MKAIEQFKNIIYRYYITKEIKDREHLVKILNKEFTINQFNEIINLSITSDLDLIDDILNVGFLMKYFNTENEHTLRKMLLLNFHQSHEDIVSLLQSNYNNDKENIPVLLNSINTIPDYLSPSDFKYPYIRKIIYAIGSQTGPYNIEALEVISRSEDEKIKELAIHQIEKRKRLGRWEAKEQ